MDSIIQTKSGGLVFVLLVTFGGAALLYFGGSWFVVRFSDPKWLKKYTPLFAFVAVTMQILRLIMALIGRRGSNQLAGILLVFYSVFIAACVGAWRRYVAAPDGPAEPPPQAGGSSGTLKLASQPHETRTEE